MIEARLSLVDALDTAIASTPDPALRGVLTQVRTSIRQGRSLSESLARRPDVFSPLYIDLVRVGETAGALDQVLNRLAEHLEKSAAVRRTLQTALAYPALILVIAALVVTLFLTTIVPTFADMFAGFGAELPAPTRFVIALSDALAAHGGLFALGSLGAGIGLAAAGRSASGRRVRDRCLLALPLLGRLTTAGLMARFCRTLGTLLAGGVPLVEALTLLGRSTGNLVLDGEVERLAGRVRRGGSLTGALPASGLFPPLVIQLTAAGEHTAGLDRLMLHAGAHYERELDAFVDAATALIEPVLIVIVGLVIGGLLLALYLPMFDLVQVIQ